MSGCTVPYVDIHTHLSHKQKDCIRVQNIYPGDKFDSFQGRNFYSLGLHPWRIGGKKENKQLIEQVAQTLQFEHVLFVGEAGLDKIINNKFGEQKRVFEAQICLAEEFERPMIIHCVRAFNEIIEMYNYHKPKLPWILHGYNGSIELTKQLENLGFLFSFGKNLFRDNSKAVQAVKYLPADKLFFETDELYWKVSDVYAKAAEIRGDEVTELTKKVWENFNRVESSLLVSLNI